MLTRGYREVKKLLANARSDIGRVRETNEDSYACGEALYMVADGMGGHAAGEVASRLTVEAVRASLAAAPCADEEGLREAFSAANARVLEKARSQEAYAGMGSTASAVCIVGGRCVWAHVGDSRIYLLRGGALQQITRDHSLVWDMVERGAITREEAALHPKRNMLTRAIGADAAVEIDAGAFGLEPGDQLLLCTDGLTNMVAESEIQSVLEADGGPEEKVNALIERALVAGGTDNVTAVVAAYGGAASFGMSEDDV